MKRFTLRSLNLEFDWFAIRFCGYPMALGAVLIASHGDILGAAIVAIGCLATIAWCSMDWSHY